ncbi:MAG: InlB B-repeat-containing protein [Paludibacteraceae bacterium]|nr:InlB B-repeat-containing protein [Paludibacteraceae bacterium]
MDLTNLMCKDIYYANKRNIFVFDRDAQTESFKRKELVLKCNWLNADNTWQYGPNDGDRNGIFITLDQLKFDTKNNKPYYYDAEKEYFLKHQDKVVLREKQEIDLQTVLEGLERREQQKKERKELREAKKAEEKVNIENVADVVADDKVVLPDTVNAEPEKKKALGKINANGHEYVDLGLPSGTLWATCNVGATKPEEYGDYFAWGETEPKDEYNWKNYKWCDGISHSINKYCNDSEYGKVDNKTILELCDDVANVKWGGDWRMPTKKEQDELRNFTIWTWINQNGIKGYKVTSKINGNSIFLPAAGYRYNSDLSDAGSGGYYWGSSLYTYYSYYACFLSFGSDNVYGYSRSRNDGLSVRPVLRVEFTLSFVPNGGQGEMPAVVKPFKQAFTLPTCTFSRNGYEFIGWNTQPDGTGEKYEAGDTISLSANTALYAQWKEIPTKENMHNGHEYVDLGLPSGTLWATCNVGATKPEEYGDYFAWGETMPQKEYNEKNYKWYQEDCYHYTKYCLRDNKKVLDLVDDAAQVNWGGDWCMPTSKDIEELKNRCLWIYFKLRGVEGYRIISKINGNSIFLPAKGWNSEISYWSDVVYDDGRVYAKTLTIFSRDSNFTKTAKEPTKCFYEQRRVSGMPIRPVLHKKIK